MPLRPYQHRAVAAVLAAFERVNAVCLVSPPRSGKTVMARAILERLQPMLPLWMAHVRELLDQAKREGVRARFHTVQALLQWDTLPQSDLLVLDEAHRYGQGAPEYHAIGANYPRRLLLTATPQRHDGTPIDLADEMVVAANYQELIKDGHLVRCRVRSPGEVLSSGVAQRPVDAYLTHAEGRPGITYISRVEKVHESVDSFKMAGVRAAGVTGKTPDDEREAVVKAFRAGELDMLVNDRVFTEGLDVPRAEVCILAVLPSHAGGYLQRVNRVLTPSEGKTEALLLDLVGASLPQMHGPPDVDREYSLDGRPIRMAEEAAWMNCEACGLVHRPGLTTCPHCGHVRKVPRRALRVWNLPLEEARAHAKEHGASAKELAMLNWRERLTRDDNYALEWMSAKVRKGWTVKRAAGAYYGMTKRRLPGHWWGVLHRVKKEGRG